MKENKKLGKSGTNNTEAVASEGESEEESSEEYSTKKACSQQQSSKSRNQENNIQLTEKLSNLQEEKRKNGGEGLFIALRAKSAREEDKLGLSWAKLSPCWDFGLIEISLNRVETSLSK